ncbi:uncharacterized protein MICPUCDRAFT_69747, partial [Micromonas pusilla CCMP1545]
MLGRSVQAAPAQAASPGWMLVVDDAGALDPLSMGLIRAVLEHCSVPMVVLMCHDSVVKEGRHGTFDPVLVSMHSKRGRGKGSALSPNLPTIHDDDRGSDRGSDTASVTASVDSLTSTSLTRSYSERSSSNLKGGSGRDKDFLNVILNRKNDVWGVSAHEATATHATATAVASAKADLEWMLSRPGTSRVVVEPFTENELRVLVERRAAVILTRERGGVSGGGRDRDAGAGGTDALANDSTATGGGGKDADADDRDALFNTADSSSSSDKDKDKDGAAYVGLPASLHDAIYSTTRGDPLYAARVIDLLIASRAVVATETTDAPLHGGPAGWKVDVAATDADVVDRSSDTGLSVDAVCAMSLSDVVLEVIERRLSQDAQLAMRALAAAGTSFPAALACVIVQRRMSIVARDVVESEFESRSQSQSDATRSGGRTMTRMGVDDDDEKAGGAGGGGAGGGGGGKSSSFDSYAPTAANEHGVLLAYDVVSFASRAAKAIEELMEEGHIVAQWGSLSDALDAAKVAENDATLEFAAANVPFPLKQPRCLAAAPASDPMGGEGNRGRVARTPHMSFANAVTREILYASMPPRDRREIHLDVVGVLKSDAAHAEDILGDLAAAACLNDEAAYHLEVVQRIDRAALESAAHSASFFHRGKSEKEKTGGAGGASELGGSGGASPSRSRRPSVGGVSASSGNSVSSDLSSSSLDAGLSPSSSSMRSGSLATVAFKSSRELSSHRSHGAAGVPPFRTFGHDHVAVRVAGLIAAANGLRARVQCHENAAKAHLRHGGARAALTSVSAAGVAAHTWVESSHALQKAFGKTHPEAVASATLGVNDTRC